MAAARFGSTDTFSLRLGSITLAFDDNVLVDEPGPDLLVFENAFLPTGLTTLSSSPSPPSSRVSGDAGTPFRARSPPHRTTPAAPGWPISVRQRGRSHGTLAARPVHDTDRRPWSACPSPSSMPPAGAGGERSILRTSGSSRHASSASPRRPRPAPGLEGLSGFDLDLAAVHSFDVAGASDSDGDSYPDAAGRLPDGVDPAQRDGDGDGVGDACEDGGCSAEITDGKLTLTGCRRLPVTTASAGRTLAPCPGATPDPRTSGSAWCHGRVGGGVDGRHGPGGA
jgi:hypothetical protein